MKQLRQAARWAERMAEREKRESERREVVDLAIEAFQLGVVPPGEACRILREYPEVVQHFGIKRIVDCQLNP